MQLVCDSPQQSRGYIVHSEPSIPSQPPPDATLSRDKPSGPSRLLDHEPRPLFPQTGSPAARGLLARLNRRIENFFCFVILPFSAFPSHAPYLSQKATARPSHNGGQRQETVHEPPSSNTKPGDPPRLKPAANRCRQTPRPWSCRLCRAPPPRVGVVAALVVSGRLPPSVQVAVVTQSAAASSACIGCGRLWPVAISRSRLFLAHHDPNSDVTAHPSPNPQQPQSRSRRLSRSLDRVCVRRAKTSQVLQRRTLSVAYAHTVVF
jgi:hypothetical protein